MTEPVAPADPREAPRGALHALLTHTGCAAAVVVGLLIAGWLLPMLVLGDRATRVDVSRVGDAYRIVTTVCGYPHNPSIESLDVYERLADGNARQICGLQKTTEQFKVKYWDYGTELAGFTKSPCEPLQPGRRYRILAHGPALLGALSFELDASGEIKASTGTCHD